MTLNNRCRITQKLQYFQDCTITHVTFFMANRLREDMFVGDGIQRYSHKLVIQFQGQTDESMQKNILNEFVKPNSKSHLHLRD